MKQQTFSLLCAAGALAMTFTIASAHAARPDTSTLVHEVTINAPVADVWDAFTTQQGIESWMVPKADIDFRVGGTLRTSYDPNAALDGPNAIHHRILAFEPQRMLAMKVVRCPEGFEFADHIEQTWEVIYFQPLAFDRTHIRAVGLGYGTGGTWDQMRAFFDQGNAWTYQQLQKKFDDEGDDASSTAGVKNDDPEAVLEILSRLAGHTWIHESEQDGRVFRVRNRATKAPDGKGLVVDGELDFGNGYQPHMHTIVYQRPDSEGGGVGSLGIDEEGRTARGTIVLKNRETILWHWPHTSADGSTTNYRIELTFSDDGDSYQWTMLRQQEDGSWALFRELEFERMEEMTDSD